MAPATASKPTTITQKYQYSQPLVKPAPHRASGGWLGERSERGVCGGHLAEHPHHEHDQDAGEHIGGTAAGPVTLITAPEPTKRPAPITPPSAIMVGCR
jgi:hypothetical protein